MFLDTQVLASFLVTAALTLLATIAYTILKREPVKIDGRPSFNPLDRLLRVHICKPVQEFCGTRLCKILTECLYDLIVSFSDTQVVTGNALLVAALYKMWFSNSMTIYHLTIVSDCAWFSVNTHALTLFVITSQNPGHSSTPRLPALGGADVPPHKRRSFYLSLPMVTRFLLQTTLITMMLYINWIRGAEDWFDVFTCPAACSVDLPKGGRNLKWTITNFVLVLVFFASIWVLRFRHYFIDDKGRACGGLIYYGRTHHPGQQSPTPRRGWRNCLRQAMSALKEYLLLPLWYLVASETEAVLEQMAWYGVGVWSTIGDRAYGHELMGSDESALEKGWGFGQLVPLLLLLLPVLQLLASLDANLNANIVHVP